MGTKTRWGRTWNSFSESKRKEHYQYLDRSVTSISDIFVYEIYTNKNKPKRLFHVLIDQTQNCFYWTLLYLNSPGLCKGLNDTPMKYKRNQCLQCNGIVSYTFFLFFFKLYILVLSTVLWRNTQENFVPGFRNCCFSCLTIQALHFINICLLQASLEQISGPPTSNV